MLQCTTSGRGQRVVKRGEVTNMECLLERKLIIDKQNIYSECTCIYFIIEDTTQP